MRAQAQAHYPIWDPEGVSEPYLLDLSAQASWGGFDPARPVFSGLVRAMRERYGRDYDFSSLDQVLRRIDYDAHLARSRARAHPNLRPSLFETPKVAPTPKPEPLRVDRVEVEEVDNKDGLHLQVAKVLSARWVDSETDHSSELMPLNTGRLYKSLAPTWLALVGFCWIALIWGAVISMPIGIGVGIAGTMFAGIIIVPLFATVFGFAGMSRASAGALRDIDFEEVAEQDPLMIAAKRYSALLGIPTPRVGVMGVDNAFAMGSSHHDAVVAIGKPLQRSMTTDQVNAVLAHELGHVVSGDMRRMMLMRCFQNATVWYMFAQGAKQFMRWVISWAGELFILAFSRSREYWADAIGAELAGKEAMIGALRALHDAPPLTKFETTHARFMIRGRFSGLLNTHPSFEERVAALKQETYLRRLPRG